MTPQMRDYLVLHLQRVNVDAVTSVRSPVIIDSRGTQATDGSNS